MTDTERTILPAVLRSATSPHLLLKAPHSQERTRLRAQLRTASSHTPEPLLVETWTSHWVLSAFLSFSSTPR